ncbi:PREDICTED: 23 kDa integral membrane protein-like [Polistes dominula]|uniref:Tetraspanin n=1 Tax=Polistes dominula TaxID=743375 RepID=A0ABM1IC61_POLDO|nr:PREDICTED: 23 kDa integral membrane protein-like [Polistes dominula]
MARALGCLRYLLIVGTIVLGISGIVASIFAGFFLYQLAEYKQLTPDNVYGPSITLLVLGLFTCAVGWLSWHFLEFTQKSQVILFVISLTIIGIFEITGGIWALVRHEQLDFLPTARLGTVFVAKDNQQLWEHIQTKFQCCGMDGPTDYRGQNSVPWSCCDTSLSLKSNNDKSTCTSIYARGCHHVMISRARSILLHVFLLSLGALLLKICLIICSTCYVKAFTESIERRRHDALTRRISSQVIYQADNNSKLLNRQSSLNETT